MREFVASAKYTTKSPMRFTDEGIPRLRKIPDVPNPATPGVER